LLKNGCTRQRKAAHYTDPHRRVNAFLKNFCAGRKSAVAIEFAAGFRLESAAVEFDDGQSPAA